MVYFTMFKSSRALLFSVLVYAIIVQAQDTLDDRDPTISYSPAEGLWNSIGDSFAVGGSFRRGQDASATATITHEFTTFRFISPLWPYPAKMQLTIDGGVPQIIDLQDYTAVPGDPSGPSTQQAAVRYTSPGMPIGGHTIVFEPVTNSDRPFVVVDSLEFSQVPVPVGPGGGPGGNPGGGPGGGGPGGPGGGPGSGTGSGTGGGPGTGGGSTNGGSGTPTSGGSSGGSTTSGTSGGGTSTSGSNSGTSSPAASSTNSATNLGDSPSPTANPDPVGAAAEKRPNRGLIGGLSAMGVIILIIILAGLALFLRRRRHQQRQRRVDYASEFKPTLIDGPPVPQNPENGQHGVLVAQSEKDVEGYFGAAAASSAPSISPSTSTASPARVPVPYHLAAIPTVSLVTQPITLDGNDAIPRRSGVFDDGGPVRTSLAPSDMTNPAVFYDARSTPTPTGAASQPQATPSAPASPSGSASTFSPPPSTIPTAERTTPPGARPPSILPGTANSNPFASSKDELAGLTTPTMSSDGMPERESQQLSLATRDSVAERIWDNVTPAVKK